MSGTRFTGSLSESERFRALRARMKDSEAAGGSLLELITGNITDGFVWIPKAEVSGEAGFVSIAAEFADGEVVDVACIPYEGDDEEGPEE